jgi:hypothetical protein
MHSVTGPSEQKPFLVPKLKDTIDAILNRRDRQVLI